MDPGIPMEDERAPVESEGILSGMRVVEAAAFVAAPLGGMTLAQMGADVIRIDALGGGLDYRRWPVTEDGTSLFWCGLNKAKYHLMTGEPVSGIEAERIGLVSLTVADDELLDRAWTVANQLAQGSPTAIRWTKYALNNWLRQAGPTFDASLALEFLGFTGPDIREGLSSLREKREPNFADDAPL